MSTFQGDELLRRIQEPVLRIKANGGTVNEHDDELLQLCWGLEAILRDGLKDGMFGIVKRDYWSWIVSIQAYCSKDKQNPFLSSSIYATKNCKKVRTCQGRGRYFIRLALKKKILGIPIEFLIRRRDLLASYYEETAVLCSCEQSDTFLGILGELTHIEFNINIKNCSFLDETWMIPAMDEVDIVPCKKVGLGLRHVQGRVIVVSVKPGSTGEFVGVQPGDILDELMGTFLYNVNAGKIFDIVHQNKGKPLVVTLVRGRLPGSSKPFPPCAKLVNWLCLRGECEDIFAISKPEKPEDKEDGLLLTLPGFQETPVQDIDAVSSHAVRYLGSVYVGMCGGVDLIEDAVASVIKQNRTPKVVILKLTEISVIILDVEASDKTMLVNSYTEISSCGRRRDQKECFGFISGETTCTIAQRFYCHVFQADTSDIARVILCSIAQGFGRTLWSV